MDEWTVLNLGESNSIIHDIKLSEFSSDNVIFTFDDYEEIIGIYAPQGTGVNDFLTGTDGNDWMMGGDEFLGRSADGLDYFFPKNGNDIIIGGNVDLFDDNDHYALTTYSLMEVV